MNRLKRRRKIQPKLTPEQIDERDALERKMLAAHLIALRIVNDIPYTELLDKLGRLSPPKPSRFGSKKRQKQYEAAAEVMGRKLEAGLANERFSLFQRYARIVGFRIDAGIEQKRRRPTPLQLSRYIRGRQKLLGRMYGRRPRPRFTA